jgi:hypothetical protein
VHLVRWPQFGLLFQLQMTDDDERVVVGGVSGRGNLSTHEKTYPSATLSTTNPT